MISPDTEFAEKKEKVLAQLEEFQTQTQNIIEVIENPEVIAALRQDKLQNLHFLKENYNVSWHCIRWMVVWLANKQISGLVHW